MLMSKRELSRIEVLARLDGGRLTISAAAETLNLPSRDLNPAWTAAAARLRSPLRRARLLQRPPSDIFNFAQQKTSQLGCNKFRRWPRTFLDDMAVDGDDATAADLLGAVG